MPAILFTLIASWLLVACGPSTAPPSPEPVTGAGTVTIDEADRACTADADCTTILIQCGACAGACTGVRSDRVATYQGRLDCSSHTGARCDYDCRAIGIEQPRCVNARCESVRSYEPTR